MRVIFGVIGIAAFVWYKRTKPKAPGDSRDLRKIPWVSGRGTMRHVSIDWLVLYISLIAAIMLVSGIIWCVSPMRFVNGYRALIFRNKVTSAKWWESAVCSKSGRVCGALLAYFGVFILYQLWIGEFR